MRVGLKELILLIIPQDPTSHRTKVILHLIWFQDQIFDIHFNMGWRVLNHIRYKDDQYRHHIIYNEGQDHQNVVEVQIENHVYILQMSHVFIKTHRHQAQVIIVDLAMRENQMRCIIKKEQWDKVKGVYHPSIDFQSLEKILDIRWIIDQW